MSITVAATHSGRRSDSILPFDVEERIRHYQRSIDRSLADRDRVIHCIEQLSKLPVTVLHLEVTGVGRQINSLRKLEDGVGDAARILVTKWKTMVSSTTSSNNDEDEACVPDAPESYESPDHESERDSNITRDSTLIRDPSLVSYDEPEALRRPALSPPGELSIDDNIESFNYLQNPEEATMNVKEESTDERKHKSSKHRHSSGKCSKKHSHHKSHRHKHKHHHESKDEESSKHPHKCKKKDKGKSKHDSSSSSSTSSNKEKKDSEDKKRKIEANSDSEGNDTKRIKLSSSEEDEGSDKSNIASLNEESGEEMRMIELKKDEMEEKEMDKLKKISVDEELKKESSRKGMSHSDTSKYSISSNHKSKSTECNDKMKKNEIFPQTTTHERESNNLKESKTKGSHSSSSNKDKSKHKGRDKSKSKHSKEKDSSGKDKKEEKDKSTDKSVKDSKSKSEGNKERKEHKDLKESEEHKKNKENKKQKDSKELKKEQRKEKREAEDDEDGINGTSGTSFAEALGMCPMRSKTKKKKENTALPCGLPKTEKIEQSSSTPSSSSYLPSPQSALLISQSSPAIMPQQATVAPPQPAPSSSRWSSTSATPPVKSSSSSKPLAEPPKSPESLPLLSSNVKLEPLSKINDAVDLAATLPEPSPNYRPMPQMNHHQRKLEEDQMLSQVIHSKNQRTKVYSGNKTGITTVPRLQDLCIRTLIENIEALEYTGGVPFFIIKPVLERANVDQLFMLEHHNPYLIGETDSIWQFHCGKDFRTKKREEMESWREMYLRCLDEREAKLKALTHNIKQSIDKSAPVRSAKMVSDLVVKPPRNVLRQQAKYGTAFMTAKASDLKKKLTTDSLSSNARTSQNSSSSCNSSSISDSESINVVSRVNRVSRVPATNTKPVAPAAVPQNRVVAPTVKKTKAPLMAKALQAIKGRYRR